MGKVFVTQRKGRNSLYVAWRQHGKLLMRPTGAEDPDWAERVREQVQAVLDGRQRQEQLYQIIIDAGMPTLPDPRIRLDQVGEFYLEQRPARRRKDRTTSDKLGKLRQFIKWMGKLHPEVVYVHELTAQVASEYMTALHEAGSSGQTQNNHLSALRSIWSEIRIPAYLRENPWEAVPRVAAVRASKRAFTLYQVRALYIAAQEFDSRWHGFWPAAIALGFHTGLRLSDVIELEASEYHTEAGVLRLIPNKTWKKGQPLVLTLHKDFDRWVPNVQEGFFWPVLAESYALKGTEVFSEWRTLIKQALGLATRRPVAEGEQRTQAVVEYGFHSLRHTYISLARQVGAPIDDIQYTVGHGSPAMTEHYDQSLEAARRTGELMPALTAN